MVAQLAPYAGQQVLTGRQAQVYADWFIGQHLYAMPYHGVYSQISGAYMAAKPGSAKATQLGDLRQTSFMGTSLRGMLLDGICLRDDRPDHDVGAPSPHSPARW